MRGSLIADNVGHTFEKLYSNTFEHQSHLMYKQGTFQEIRNRKWDELGNYGQDTMYTDTTLTAGYK